MHKEINIFQNKYIYISDVQIYYYILDILLLFLFFKSAEYSFKIFALILFKKKNLMNTL